MPTTVLQDDIAHIRVFCSLEEQVSINNLYYHIGIISGAPTDLQVATGIAALLAPLYKPLMSAVARYEGVGISIFRSNVRFTNEIHHLTGAGVGTGTGDPLPGQVAGLIRKVSNAAGRHAYGRIFVPFPSEDMNDTDGTPTSAYVTDLNDLAAICMATGNIDAGGGVLFGCTGRHRVAGTLGAPLFLVATEMSGRTDWATLRSRGDRSASNKLPWA